MTGSGDPRKRISGSEGFRLKRKLHTEAAREPIVEHIRQAVARIVGSARSQLVRCVGQKCLIVVALKQIHIMKIHGRARLSGAGAAVQVSEPLTRGLLVEQILRVKFEPDRFGLADFERVSDQKIGIVQEQEYGPCRLVRSHKPESDSSYSLAS